MISKVFFIGTLTVCFLRNIEAANNNSPYQYEEGEIALVRYTAPSHHRGYWIKREILKVSLYDKYSLKHLYKLKDNLLYVNDPYTGRLNMRRMAEGALHESESSDEVKDLLSQNTPNDDDIQEMMQSNARPEHVEFNFDNITVGDNVIVDRLKEKKVECDGKSGIIQSIGTASFRVAVYSLGTLNVTAWKVMKVDWIRDYKVLIRTGTYAGKTGAAVGYDRWTRLFTIMLANPDRPNCHVFIRVGQEHFIKVNRTNAPEQQNPNNVPLEQKSDDSSEDTEDHPDHFVCPITWKLMKDPVVACDGHSYERTAIVRWFLTKDTSPKTNLQLSDKSLRPNSPLQKAIRRYKKSKENMKKSEENIKKSKENMNQGLCGSLQGCTNAAEFLCKNKECKNRARMCMDCLTACMGCGQNKYEKVEFVFG